MQKWLNNLLQIASAFSIFGSLVLLVMNLAFILDNLSKSEGWGVGMIGFILGPIFALALLGAIIFYISSLWKKEQLFIFKKKIWYWSILVMILLFGLMGVLQEIVFK